VVTRWSHTTEAQVRSQAPSYGIFCGKLALGQVLIPALRLSFANILPPVLHSHSLAHPPPMINNLSKLQRR
jgi:hypothetical protein